VNPFAFIVGCPRSGTTLLGRMVDAHPDIAVIHEGRFAPDWYERRRGLTAAGLVTPELIGSLLGHPPFKNVSVGREELEGLLDGGAPGTYADFVAGIFDLHGRAHGKRLVGDKTPHYVRSLPTLHSLWPAAKIVHLIRDGRDVTQSALGWRKVTERGGSVARFSTFRDDRVATVACWWEWLVRLGREDGAAIGPAGYHEVRYEALVADPDATVREICAFAGIPYEPSMLDYAGAVDVSTKAHQQRLLTPPTTGVRSWRDDMSAADAAGFEAVAGDLLRELEYDVTLQRSSGARTTLTRAWYDARLAAWNISASMFQRSPLWPRRHPRLSA
jgi:hypothetical protein